MARRIPHVSTLYVTAQRLRVLDVLTSARQPLHVRDIAHLADVTRETAYMNVRRLVEQGWVVTSYAPGVTGGRGRTLYYEITPTGRLRTTALLNDHADD